MKVKLGVSLLGLKLEMKPVMEIVEVAFQCLSGRESVITSGTETQSGVLNSQHMAGSYHYFGYALDFRIRHVQVDVVKKIVESIRKKLAEISVKYKVVLEDTHIHIQYSV